MVSTRAGAKRICGELPLREFLGAVRSCTICRDDPFGAPLPHEPRPTLNASPTATILVAGQAPGLRVHETGLSFNDRSGDRLRDWMGIDRETFYDANRIAIAAMGFCFPGYDGNGGDLPPRRECAPTWRDGLMARLPNIRLVLCIGLYSQRYHLGPPAPAEHDGNGAELARDHGRDRGGAGAGGDRPAAPLVAQYGLAEAQSLVRG